MEELIKALEQVKEEIASGQPKSFRLVPDEKIIFDGKPVRYYIANLETENSGEGFVGELEGHACGELITSEGRPNGESMAKLKKAGYSVGPGEQDSFGWLTGVIGFSVDDKNYRFVYG